MLTYLEKAINIFQFDILFGLQYKKNYINILDLRILLSSIYIGGYQSRNKQFYILAPFVYANNIILYITLILGTYHWALKEAMPPFSLRAIIF